MLHGLVICGIFLYYSLSVKAQENDSDEDAQAVTRFNPLLNAAVISPGTVETTFYNLMESRVLEIFPNQVTSFDTVSARQSTLSQILQLNYGLPFTGKFNLNVGVDLYYTHLRIDENPNSSFLRVLGNDESTGMSHRSFSAMGPRIRLIPVRTIPELSLQSALRFPLTGDYNKQLRFGVDRVMWQNQMIFYQTLFRNFSIQLSAGNGIYFKNDERRQTTHNLNGVFVTTYRLPFRGRLENSFYILLSLAYNENREKSFSTGKMRRLYYDFTLGGGLYYRIVDTGRHRLSTTLVYEYPFAYDIGSLTTRVVPGRWWRLNFGINYNFSFR